MKISDIPTKFVVPFASAAQPGYIRTVPTIPTGTPGQASMQLGFPPDNFNPLGAGGVPPFGQDFNGLLNQSTAWTRFQQCGVFPPYDPTFQSDVGGYPKWSTVSSLVTPALVWLSLTDDNVTNPDIGGAGWVAFSPVSIPSPTLWVRTDGNDNNSGQANNAASAMKTISAAISKAANTLNLAGRTLAIRLGNPGIYVGATINSIPSLSIVGDTANISNYVITPGVDDNPIAVTGCSLNLSGVLINNNVNTGSHSIQAAYGGSITLSNVQLSGSTGIGSSSDLRVSPGGSITIGGPITFARNTVNAILAQGGGSVTAQVSVPITYSGSPIYTGANVSAVDGGVVLFADNTITGAATGQRYSAVTNAVISTGSGSDPNYFPGTVAGATSLGGVYR